MDRTLLLAQSTVPILEIEVRGKSRDNHNSEKKNATHTHTHPSLCSLPPNRSILSFPHNAELPHNKHVDAGSAPVWTAAICVHPAPRFLGDEAPPGFLPFASGRGILRLSIWQRCPPTPHRVKKFALLATSKNSNFFPSHKKPERPETRMQTNVRWEG